MAQYGAMHTSMFSSSMPRSEDDTTVDVERDELVESAANDLKKVSGDFKVYSFCTIHKVIPYVKINDENCEDSYHPKLISIGPFHHDREKLKPMEGLKLRFLDDLLNRSLDDTVKDHKLDMLDQLFGVVRLNLDKAKDLYSDKVGEDEKLVKMLVYDGCFMIEFLLKWYLKDIAGHLTIAHWSLPLLRSDLLLLENQIPFFILQSLYYQVKPAGTDLPDLFSEIALSYLMREKDVPFSIDIPDDEIHHLLHLYQLSLNPELHQVATDEISQNPFFRALVWIHHWIWICIRNPFVWICFYILPLDHRVIKGAVEHEEAGVTFEKKNTQAIEGAAIFKKDEVDKGNENNGDDIEMGNFQTNTNESNVDGKETTTENNGDDIEIGNFQTNTNESNVKDGKKKSINHCFLKVTFQDGKFTIPPLTIDSNKVTLLLNLLAFEQSGIDGVDKYVTTYVSLMDRIIDTSNDVDVLQKARIINNHLSNHEEVAHLFNTLGGGVPLDWNDEGAYGKEVQTMIKEMNEYCSQRIHRYRASLLRDYFTSPWSFIALVGALVALALTMVQTYYGIHPAK